MDRLVGVADRDVLSDEGDTAMFLRLRGLFDERIPHRVLDGPDVEMELTQHLLVESLFAEFARHGVDRIRHVLFLDHALMLHVAEERELLLVLFGYRHFRAADEDIGDDADVAEHPHGMLRRLGLQFARRLEVGNEREMHEACVFGTFLEAELARRLKERQAFDIARYAADLAQHDVAIMFPRAADRRLDFVRDVRNDLYGTAEVAAGALAREDGGVDAAGGVVACLRTRDAREALVVSEVEVGLRAVIRHEHLAVLVRRHRAGIDVEIGVQLLHEHLVTAAFQEERKRCARDALAEGTHHPAGDEHVFDLLFHRFCGLRTDDRGQTTEVVGCRLSIVANHFLKLIEEIV